MNCLFSASPLAFTFWAPVICYNRLFDIPPLLIGPVFHLCLAHCIAHLAIRSNHSYLWHLPFGTLPLPIALPIAHLYPAHCTALSTTHLVRASGHPTFHILASYSLQPSLLLTYACLACIFCPFYCAFRIYILLLHGSSSNLPGSGFNSPNIPYIYQLLVTNACWELSFCLLHRLFYTYTLLFAQLIWQSTWFGLQFT